MKIYAIILAAGKGTRMNEGRGSPIPKVMFEILGKPIIHYSVDLIKKAGIENVIVVVGYKKEMIMDCLGDKVLYAVQEEQLGTGHAAMMAESLVKESAKAIIIFYGDNPLYKPETVRRLIKIYIKQKPTIAMLSVKFKDPEFWGFGRIIRNKLGNVIGIVEQKDCKPEQLKIQESNTGFYIFDSRWFWENCRKIETNNVQKEYYLTDIIKIACAQGGKIIAMPVSEEKEALGINTPEQLKQAEEVIRKGKII